MLSDEFAIFINRWKATDEYSDAHYSDWISTKTHAPANMNGTYTHFTYYVDPYKNC